MIALLDAGVAPDARRGRARRATGCRPRGPRPRRLGGAPAATSRPAAGRSSSPTTTTPTSTTPPRSCSRCGARERRRRRRRRPRRRLDGRDAVERRRLGAFDADNTSALPREAAVLRLRRGHRPAERRRHRARGRDARARGPRGRAPRRGAASTGCCASRSPTARGSAAGARTTSTAPAPRCPRSPPAGSPGTRASARAVALAGARQNADGGWGEDLRSYRDPAWRGRGASTASQTAWALLALLRRGRDAAPAVERGVRWLVDDAARRRQLGRAVVHRHRLPRRLLHQLPPLPARLPGHGARAAARGRRCADELLVFAPLRIEARDAAGARRAGRCCARAWGRARARIAAARGARRRRRPRSRSSACAPAVVARAARRATSSARPSSGARARVRSPCPAARSLAAALRRRGLRVHVGPILSVDHVVDRVASARGLARRRRARRRHGVGVARRRPPTDGRSPCPRRRRQRRARPAATRARSPRASARCAPCAARRAALDEWAAAVGPRTVLLAGAALVLRRRRAGDRDRRARARAARRAGLRAQADRAQRPRRRRPRAPRRGLRRRARRGARRRDGRLLRARRLARGADAGRRRARPRRDRRDLPAGGQGARRGAPLRRRRARRSSSIGHAGHEEVEGTLGEAPDAIRVVEDVAGRASSSTRRDPTRVSPTSRRPRSPSTRRTRSSARCASASRAARARRRTTSATPRPTASRPCAPSRASPTSCSSSARRTPRTRSAWSRSPQREGTPRVPGRRRARRRPRVARRRRDASASPPARPRPQQLVDRLVAALARPRARRRRGAHDDDRVTSSSRCPRRCADMSIPLRQSVAVGALPAEAEAQAATTSSRCSSSSSRCSPCNLACAGCGKIQHPSTILKQRMPVEQALAAIEECGAPMVSIAGGEPLMHPEIDVIVARAGQAQEVRLPVHERAAAAEEAATSSSRRRTSPGWCTSTGCASGTTQSVEQEGVFDEAVDGDQRGQGSAASGSPPTRRSSTPTRRRRSATCSTSSTTSSKVDDMMISPAYAYEKAPDQEHFLGVDGRPGSCSARRSPTAGGKHWRLNHSPLFLDFLEGKVDFECTAWGIPSYSLLRLAAAVLPDGRRLREDVPGADRDDRLGSTAAARTRAAPTAWRTAATSRRPCSPRASR